MFIGKTVTGKVPNFGLTWDSNNRREKMINIRTYRSDAPAHAKNLIDQSLGVHQEFQSTTCRHKEL